MKKLDKNRILTLLLAVLVIALIAVVAYIVWQEYQYSVSDTYYDSLRNIGMVKGGRRM